MVNVAAPTPNCRAWFELESLGVAGRVYSLYLEPANPKQNPQPATINAGEGLH